MEFVHHKTAIHWPSRLRASGAHLGLSLVVALLAGLLVFGLWYPYPYREISGGRELFLLVVGVDVVLGPLITLAIFDRRKSMRELALDLAVVAGLQLAALGYGLWTVVQARPVHLVFEIDRFRVIHRAEVPDDLVGRTPAGVDALPWGRPTLLAVRPFRDNNEKLEATMAALQGLSLSARPDLWEPYAAARGRVQAAAQPLAALVARFPTEKAAIDAAVSGAGLDPGTALFLPMAGRKTFWTVIVDPASMEPVAYLPIDSF